MTILQPVKSPTRHRARAGSGLTKRMEAQGYLRVTDIAERTGVHRTTVYRWIREGLISSVDLHGAYYVTWSSVVQHLGKVAEILGLADG